MSDHLFDMTWVDSPILQEQAKIRLTDSLAVEYFTNTATVKTHNLKELASKMLTAEWIKIESEPINFWTTDEWTSLVTEANAARLAEKNG